MAQVEGARELRRALGRGADALADLKDANAAAAATVADRARLTGPRVSGRLDASVRSSGTKTQAVVRAGSRSVPYAGVIHFGWPARHIAAEPFIIDAGRATESSWVGLYLSAIQKIIDKIEESTP